MTLCIGVFAANLRRTPTDSSGTGEGKNHDNHEQPSYSMIVSTHICTAFITVGSR
jgi:hypothetical protein